MQNFIQNVGMAQICYSNAILKHILEYFNKTSEK